MGIQYPIHTPSSRKLVPGRKTHEICFGGSQEVDVCMFAILVQLENWGHT